MTWTSGGGLTDLGVLTGRNDSEALAINASNEVVGTSLDFGTQSDNWLAFIYLPVAAYTLSSGMSSLGTLGGDDSVGRDINDTGMVVGGAQQADGDMRPFSWTNGAMTDLGNLGGESSSILHRAEASMPTTRSSACPTLPEATSTHSCICRRLRMVEVWA